MNSNDELGTLLGQELHHRADGIGSAPLTLTDVQGKARHIRRNRAIAGIVGTAAAVAIVIPAAVFAGHGLGSADAPPPVASRATALPDSSVPIAELDVTGLPQGTAPRTPWVDEDGTVHLPDGTTSTPDLPAAPSGIAVLADGRKLVLTAGAGGNRSLTLVGTDGSTRDLSADSAPRLNADHTVAAWVAVNGDVTVLQEGRDAPIVLGPVTGSARVVVAVTGSDCTTTDAAGACTVYVQREEQSTGERTTQFVSSTGRTGTADLGAGRSSLTDLGADGRMITMLSASDYGSCWGVVDGTSSDHPLLWKTCRNGLDAFSPDGRHLLAGSAYADGVGDGELALYTADGVRVVDLKNTEKSQAFYHDAVWEDDTHVLVTVSQRNTWSIVRVSVDGTAELAVPPVEGAFDRTPFFLQH